MALRCMSSTSVRSTAKAGITTTPPRAAVRVMASANSLARPGVVVATVAVGGLDQDDVSGIDRRRGNQEGVLLAAQIAAERDAATAVAGQVQGDHRRAEDVTGGSEGQVHTVGHLDGVRRTAPTETARGSSRASCSV